MRNIPFLPLIVCVLIFANTPLFAVILNVPDDCETIQSAIRSSDDGDTVLVQPGEYVENIDYSGKNITIASLFLTTGFEGYIDSTIINGNGAGSVVTFENEETEDAFLTGFTVQKGRAEFGGGIFCTESNSSIQYCKITQNHANSGGGAFLHNSLTTFNNCKIYNNTANNGGGVALDSCMNVELNYCIIGYNSDVQEGGGLFIEESEDILITYCLIIYNFAEIGGAACCFDSDVRYTNCTIALNSSNEWRMGGIFVDNRAYIFIKNSILWFNGNRQIYITGGGRIGVDRSDIEGGFFGIVYNGVSYIYWGYGNIDEYPLFVDYENCDFHLASDSPCIDAGDPHSPFDPDSTITDMGAYYFHQEVDNVPEIIQYPSAFILCEPYPNPFNSTTTITFGLDKSAPARLALYDMSGREVRTLFDGYSQAGFHSLNLNADDLTSGFYLVRFETAGFMTTREIVLIR
ncbi:T9SS type A sorting domain-containing protein [bacterium]|nr:T9SS type A sorting domain-containing protein [bacterium]